MLQEHQATEWQSFSHPIASTQRKNRHPALERLVCAAVCDPQLAALLLLVPTVALQRYEVGRSLSNAERRLVLSITDASDIHDFAGRLHAMASQVHRPEGSTPYEDRSIDRPTAEISAQRDSVPALTAATLLY